MTTAEVIDPSRAVRAGEELDVPALERFLAEHVPGASGPLAVEQFPSGHSNLTYLLRAGDLELVLRRPPFGNRVKTAHDMGREHTILSRLHAVYPPAPEPLAYCDDAAVLGAPFYVMRRIRGTILRRKPPAGLSLPPERVRALCESFVDNLAALHAVDYRAAGLGDLGRPEGYVERQVSGWTKRYRDARTDDIADIDGIAAWLAARIPRESGAALIHNDYKYDNLVLDPADPTRIVGVLDWEMSTIGDPLMDLGTALGYWIEAGDPEPMRALPFGPTDLPGSYTRHEIAARYAAKTGRDVSDLRFYYCFALFKTAVVAQQIYYRFHKGLTTDERFAMMIVGVRLLAERALAVAEGGAF
ncbi:MAG: phosphotransferase family protein [Deltaproteobacteria bacterium]